MAGRVNGVVRSVKLYDGTVSGCASAKRAIAADGAPLAAEALMRRADAGGEAAGAGAGEVYEFFVGG